MRAWITAVGGVAMLVGSACGRGDSPVADAGGVSDAAPHYPDGNGVIDQLRFAIVGDTRPPQPDDTAHYPTAIITKIWQDVEAESPHPQFAITTGDYMFASTNRQEQKPQLDLYMGARRTYAGVQWPAMGNHECTGATASNCGSGNADGVTTNLAAFTSALLAPIGVDKPYFVEHVTPADASYSAKFVFVACNAWDQAQADWLTAALAEPTTYTFVVRHEGVDVLGQTRCSASQPIIDAHALTLLVVGHTHTYRHEAAARQVIVGMGGAPLTSGTNYGYVIAARDAATGNLVVTAYEYQTRQVIDTFTIRADGTPG